MPCDASYMEANYTEVNAGQVLLLLDELNGEKLSPKKWSRAGYDKGL